MRHRTQARELALQFLYQLDLVGEDKLRDMEAFLAAEDPPASVLDYARSLIIGVHESWERLSREIAAAATNWSLERMAVVDRNILRLALYELLYREDVPPKVAINEAVELAKRYSTEQSGAFVNGILDSVAKRENIPYDRGGGHDSA